MPELIYETMKSLFVFAFGISALLAQGQEKLSIYVAAEETVTLGDQRSSFEFRSFTQLAANSGLRAGFSYAFNDNFSGQATLGVVGSSRPNSWFTKLVPVEITAQYNLISLTGIDTKYRFNADLGIGSALVRAQSSTYNNMGTFNFSEHASLGASFEIPFTDLGILSFGLRHSFFIDDYIDATVQGEDNDRLMRFYTAVKVPLGISKGIKNNLADAEQKGKELTTLLHTLESTSTAEQKINESKMAALTTELALANSQINVLTEQLGESQKFILQSVHFPINEYSIAFTEIAELQSLLEILTTQPALKADIIGHTDNSGNASFNNTLSLLRANAVADWLINRGIDSTRLTAKAESSSHPIVPNTSSERRAVNRRTEIIMY